MSLCTRDKRPFQHMWMDTFTISVQILVDSAVSRYPLLWLSLNLNLRWHDVGKSESLLIPLPRASLDPLSWYFCMSALSTGGSCMAVYEYLLMLRLTWLIARVCCHDNALRCAGCSLFFQHSNASHFFLECLLFSKYVFESEGKKCWGKNVKLCRQKNFVLSPASSTSKNPFGLWDFNYTLNKSLYSRDHIDTREACFFFNSNTPFSLRGSGCFDATGAGDDLGNVSGAAASRRGHRAVCVSARVWACFAQHQHIDLGQKVIDWCLPVSRRCHSGCHTLGRCSAHAAAAGWHGNFLEPTVS